METPKVIYLQTCGDCDEFDKSVCDSCDFDNLDEVTWCKDRINDTDAVYFSEQHLMVSCEMMDLLILMNTVLS